MQLLPHLFSLRARWSSEVSRWSRGSVVNASTSLFVTVNNEITVWMTQVRCNHGNQESRIRHLDRLLLLEPAVWLRNVLTTDSDMFLSVRTPVVRTGTRVLRCCRCGGAALYWRESPQICFSEVIPVQKKMMTDNRPGVEPPGAPVVDLEEPATSWSIFNSPPPVCFLKM